MTRSLPAAARLLIAAVTVAGATMAAPAASASGRAGVQRALDDAVAKGGAPGIVAEVRDGPGKWFGSAGEADTKTGRKRQPQERFRIGSATKAFTATVVLQLAAERKLSLDDTVDTWLPGLVKGNGYDGGEITIRQLLNHTSGIFTTSATRISSSRAWVPRGSSTATTSTPPSNWCGSAWPTRLTSSRARASRTPTPTTSWPP